MGTNLLGVAEKLGGICGVWAMKDHGGSGHSGGGFSGEVRSRIARVNPVRPPVRSHVLRSLPAIVISVPISDL